MKLTDYQRAAARTAGDIRLEVVALGIAGEAGEVADIVKKVAGHGHDLDRIKLAEELGDVLWYVAVMARCIGVSLDDVAVMNIEKLRRRYPDGFSEERSRNRKETDGGTREL